VVAVGALEPQPEPFRWTECGPRLAPGPPYGYGSRPREGTREAPGIAAAPGDAWVKVPWVRRAAPLRTRRRIVHGSAREAGWRIARGEGPPARAGDPRFGTVPITTPGPGAVVVGR